MNRNEHISTFLADAGWAGAKRLKLAGDASFRHYERIYSGHRQAVLMDAPPEKEDVRPFCAVAEQLFGCGLSAPKILARDESNGLLLLEDLGDDLFARVLAKEPQREEEFYFAAADTLAELHRHTGRGDFAHFPAYTMDRFLPQVALLTEWFLPLAGGTDAAAGAQDYLPLWREALEQLPELGRVLVLYDFHAENLLWLPDREGVKRVGLLDFQDAVMGSPAYDMVSYLEDARRDVAAATVEAVLARYLKKSGLPRADFMTAYALLGAQRNCRIVGTFARLAVRDGKRQYLSYLPRVWGHLERDLKHPALAKLRAWMDATVPSEWRGDIGMDDVKRARA